MLRQTSQYFTFRHVQSDVLTGLSAKQPKTVAGCVATLKETVRSVCVSVAAGLVFLNLCHTGTDMPFSRLFGTQTTPPPPILKALPKIFAHTDKTVRAEGVLLTHALYQYIGTGIEPWLADLKPVQVKELKEGFEGMEKEGKGKGTLKPERMTRAQTREAEIRGADEEEGEPGPAEEGA